MEDMESRLGQILSDPQMMEKIMSFAQSFQTQDRPASAGASASTDPLSESSAGGKAGKSHAFCKACRHGLFLFG